MRYLWSLVDRFKLVIALAALCAPFLGLAAGAILSRRSRAPGSVTGLGAGVGCLATPILLWFAMCTPPPGRGVTSERRYREAAPLIASLEQFRHTRGVYPDSLFELVPAFLSAAILSASRMDPDGPFVYARDTAGYSLRFEYSGPAMNHCEYRPRRARWACGGYY